MNRKRQKNCLYRPISLFMTVIFTVSSLVCPSMSLAQSHLGTGFFLPDVGMPMALTPGFKPPLVKGLTLHPEDPLKFDFLVDRGEDRVEGLELSAQADKMIRYFLTALTVPDEQMWVNLSPYEKDRIIAENFGGTEMGRDLLGQDYVLKQLAASLTNPDTDLGKKYWAEVDKTLDAGGLTLDKSHRDTLPTTNVQQPASLSKVWIIPDSAQVYEQGSSVFVIKSHLKVMLEQDYQALKENGLAPQEGTRSQVFRTVILPKIEKEVNEGKTFATLRQIYQSMILAVWYKKKLKESLLGRVYVNQNKIKGVDVEDKKIKQKIYDRYLVAFKRGVYNAIKEEYDPVSQETIPRKYFSGGFAFSRVAGILGIAVAGASGNPAGTQANVATFERQLGPTAFVTWRGFEIGPQTPPEVLTGLASQNRALSFYDARGSEASTDNWPADEWGRSASSPLIDLSGLIPRVDFSQFSLTGAVSRLDLSVVHGAVSNLSEIVGTFFQEHPLKSMILIGVLARAIWVTIKNNSISYNLGVLGGSHSFSRSVARSNLIHFGSMVIPYIKKALRELKWSYAGSRLADLLYVLKAVDPQDYALYQLDYLRGEFEIDLPEEIRQLTVLVKNIPSDELPVFLDEIKTRLRTEFDGRLLYIQARILQAYGRAQEAAQIIRELKAGGAGQLLTHAYDFILRQLSSEENILSSQTGGFINFWRSLPVYLEPLIGEIVTQYQATGASDSGIVLHTYNIVSQVVPRELVTAVFLEAVKIALDGDEFELKELTLETGEGPGASGRMSVNWHPGDELITSSRQRTFIVARITRTDALQRGSSALTQAMAGAGPFLLAGAVTRLDLSIAKGQIQTMIGMATGFLRTGLLSIVALSTSSAQGGINETRFIENPDQIFAVSAADANMVNGSEHTPGTFKIRDSPAASNSDSFVSSVGGIDLNSASLDLQIKRDGAGVPLPLPQQPWETMNIQGFFPVILQISPAPAPILSKLPESPPEPVSF